MSYLFRLFLHLLPFHLPHHLHPLPSILPHLSRLLFSPFWVFFPNHLLLFSPFWFLFPDLSRFFPNHLLLFSPFWAFFPNLSHLFPNLLHFFPILLFFWLKCSFLLQMSFEIERMEHWRFLFR